MPTEDVTDYSSYISVTNLAQVKPLSSQVPEDFSVRT